VTGSLASEQEVQVQALYSRFKHLALAAGAALVLREPTARLEREVAALAAEARIAAADPAAPRPPLAACADAATELHALLRRGGSDVEPARRAHKRLRREVWKVIPCEYVPCCALPVHD
jgi:hypothetical protein